MAGRPRKAAGDKRKTEVPVRVSPDEHVALKLRASAAGLPIAAYLRASAFQAQVVNRADWQRLVYLFANLTNNLNQIARWANTYKSSVDTLAVLARLMEVERLARDIIGMAGEEPSP